MAEEKFDIIKMANILGCRSSGKDPWEILDWLREEKQIHVEVGSIWDELNNSVESYYYTVTTPICVYYTQPINYSGGSSYKEMLHQGLEEGLRLLKKYQDQKHIRVSDDRIVLAYLKGYGDKSRPTTKNNYISNLERYAYDLGRQGDYIEEGLTEDEIILIVRNEQPARERLRLI